MLLHATSCFVIDEALELRFALPSFRPGSQDETVTRAFRRTNACDELNDVGLGYGVAHHDLVHEIHYGRGWLLRF